MRISWRKGPVGNGGCFCLRDLSLFCQWISSSKRIPCCLYQSTESIALQSLFLFYDVVLSCSWASDSLDSQAKVLSSLNANADTNWWPPNTTYLCTNDYFPMGLGFCVGIFGVLEAVLELFCTSSNIGIMAGEIQRRGRAWRREFAQLRLGLPPKVQINRPGTSGAMSVMSIVLCMP